MTNARKPRIRQSLTRSSTAQTLEFFNARRDRLGEVTTVVTRSRDMSIKYGNNQPYRSHDCPRVYVRGTGANMALSGLLWGYSGEGPRGLHKVLKSLGFAVDMAQITALDRNHNAGYTFTRTATGTEIKAN